MRNIIKYSLIAGGVSIGILLILKMLKAGALLPKCVLKVTLNNDYPKLERPKCTINVYDNNNNLVASKKAYNGDFYFNLVKGSYTIEVYNPDACVTSCKKSVSCTNNGYVVCEVKNEGHGCLNGSS